MESNQLCKAVVRDGVQLIIMPNGDVIPAQSKTIIEQDADQSRVQPRIATATITIKVILEDTRGEG